MRVDGRDAPTAQASAGRATPPWPRRCPALGAAKKREQTSFRRPEQEQRGAQDDRRLSRGDQGRPEAAEAGDRREGRRSRRNCKKEARAASDPPMTARSQDPAEGAKRHQNSCQCSSIRGGSPRLRGRGRKVRARGQSRSRRPAPRQSNSEGVSRSRRVQGGRRRHRPERGRGKGREWVTPCRQGSV